MSEVSFAESLVTTNKEETEIITTNTQLSPLEDLQIDRRVKIVMPICDMGGGSAVAQVRVRREISET